MKIPVVRNIIEYSLIILWWALGIFAIQYFAMSSPWWSLVIILGCWFKTFFFGRENLSQLYDAARCNLSHHRFLVFMAINMTQMILSFALDFHLLYLLDSNSFQGIAGDIASSEALFDFFYLSALNFSFFGYSDILPQTVPAKLLNITEILLAFITVIFLLSDFVSLKDSLRSSDQQ
jgi:hypothetical protein